MSALIALPHTPRLFVPSQERARLLWETAVCDQYREDHRPMDPTCGECSYCCWSPRIAGMPRPEGGQFVKFSMRDCPHGSIGHCRIYDDPARPASCRDYECAYLRRERGILLQGEVRRGDAVTVEPLAFRIHRPQVFRSALAAVMTKRGGIFPAVPSHIPVAQADALIRETGCVPDCVAGAWRLQMVR